MPEARAVVQADEWGERMPRSVGLVDSIAVLVGVTIGSGIFRVPATVAAQLHTPGAVLTQLRPPRLAAYSAASAR